MPNKTLEEYLKSYNYKHKDFIDKLEEIFGITLFEHQKIIIDCLIEKNKKGSGNNGRKSKNNLK